MTKGELLKYLEPFSNDMEIKIGDDKLPIAPFYGTQEGDETVPLRSRSMYVPMRDSGIIVLQIDEKNVDEPG